MKNVRDDLKLWKRKVEKPSEQLEVRRQQQIDLLKKCLLEGEKIKRYRDALMLHEKSLATRVLSPEKLIPCILHGGNRTGEKIDQQLFIEGLAEGKNKGKGLKPFIQKVENAMNQHVLKRSSRHTEDCGQWRFPWDKEKKCLGDVKFSYPQVQKIMEGWDHIIDACVDNPERNAKWKKCCSLYNQVIEMLNSKRHFKWKRVCQFQKLVDEFCDLYFYLTGRDGMTNYFHMLYSGTFAYFLDKYGNLYRFSQQGWENVNGVWKRHFHHNTAKGGGKGGSSKLLPIMFTVARGMLWRSGHLDLFFDSLPGQSSDLQFLEYGQILKMPHSKDVTDEYVQAFADTIVNLGTVEDIFGDVDQSLERMFEEEREEDEEREDEESEEEHQIGQALM